MPLVLHHNTLSFPSRTALMVARAVDVDIEVKHVNLLAGDHYKEDFLKINPQHLVPVLVDDDGFTVSDSHAIAAYLVEKYGKDDSLYPRDPQKRARVNQLLFFEATLVFPRIKAICFPILFFGVTDISTDKKKDIKEVFNWLELFLKDSDWVAGPTMTIADYSCVASVISIIEVGYEVSKHREVSNWIARCKAAMAGYEENEAGAKLFSQAVRSKLKPGAARF